MTMNDAVIQVRDLGKCYRLAAAGWSPQTLPETIHAAVGGVVKRVAGRIVRSGNPPRRGGDLDFWALRHVNFDVRHGEVVGIIGRNGAGKSTLLKILSRITDPTEGQAVIRGRVASLLEVGTGFHPELSGRENIYLNGSILGMTRREIRAKFDQIVEFSGIERFLDTPIKRYSSGMTVRLAFSVAAHLDPQVLVIDEVLAVGDGAFQKKCLGKMDEVAKGGRTVLFVSHNLAAVSSLCGRCLLIERGQIAATGTTEDVIREYQSSLQDNQSIPLVHLPDRRGDGALRFTDLYVTGGNRQGDTALVCGQPARFEIHCRSRDGLPMRHTRIALVVADHYGQLLFTCFTEHAGQVMSTLPAEARVECLIDRLPLAPGSYRVHLWASVNGQEADYVESVRSFDVLEGDYFGTGQLPVPRKHGSLLVDHHWRHSTAQPVSRHPTVCAA